MSTTAPVMDPTQAAAGREFYASSLDFEFGTTKKVLAAVKEGDWKPDPKSRSAKELAWHIVSSEIWFLNGIANQDFTPSDAKEPATLQEMISFYEAEYPKAMARVRALPGDKLAQIVDFYGIEVSEHQLSRFRARPLRAPSRPAINLSAPTRRQMPGHLWR